MTERQSIDAYHPYRSRLLTPERIRELSRLRPWIAVRDAAFCWTLMLAAWSIAAAFPVWYVLLPAAVLVGSRYYALFIIGHDGLHRRIFPTHWANDLFNDIVVLAPIGAITRINNRNHLLHHRHLGNPEDPDRHRHACVNKYDHVHLLAFLTGMSSVFRATYQVFVAPLKSAADTGEGQDSRYSARDVLILGTWHLVLISGLTLTFGWWGYPLMWLAPVYVFTYLADNFRSFVEHAHTEGDDDADHHRLITFESNLVERWFLAPMHMNLHVAHHLWVGIPYYNLSTADAEMSRHPLSAELERRGSYIAYLVRYWLALPLEPCRPVSPSPR